MPPKQANKAKKYNADQPTIADALKGFVQTLSLSHFIITLIGGLVILTAASFAVIKTANNPYVDEWPVVEVTLASAEEKTLNQPNEQSEQSQNELSSDQSSEKVVSTSYEKEKDSSYQVDLTHDLSLYDTIDEGVLVPRRSGKRTVAKKYQTALFDGLKDKPFKGVISLVMVDYGLSKKISEGALKAFRGIHVTYALSPYAIDHQNWVDQARLKGHEVWLHLPMQPLDFPWVETGPMTFLARSKADENRRRLIWLLSLAKGYIGITGSKDTALIYDETELNTLMSALYEHGIAYLSLQPDNKGLEHSLTKINKVPFAKNNIFLTDTGRVDDLKASLSELETMSLQNEGDQYVIGTFSPYPKALETIAAWAKNLYKEKQIIVVPVSFQLKNEE